MTTRPNGCCATPGLGGALGRIFAGVRFDHEAVVVEQIARPDITAPARVVLVERDAADDFTAAVGGEQAEAAAGGAAENVQIFRCAVDAAAG